MANETEIVLEYSNFAAIGEQMAREIDEECERTALDIQARAQMAIQNPPKSGRIYQHGNVLHQASAPGEAPASDTGALATNVTVNHDGPSDWSTTWNEEYAPDLEYGTPTILPRPFARPAVEAVKERFLSAIRRIVGE
jgi:hypothetical protein